MKYEKNPLTKCKCTNPKHHAKWILNEKSILKSVKKILRTGDIEYLTKDSYDLVMSLSGFIAHYNIEGFKEYYRDVRRLWHDLPRSHDIINPNRYANERWFQESEQKEYYTTKSNILNGIVALLENILWLENLENKKDAEVKTQELAELKRLQEKYLVTKDVN